MKTILSIFVSCLVVILLTACVSRPVKETQWPAEIPAHAYFVQHFEEDAENKKGQDIDEYLMWVLRFYNGWELYSNGWTKTTAASLQGVKDPLVAQEIKTKMGLIGKGIAGEWAKNKSSRRVLTRHVVVWGNALIESIRRDEELKLINRVLNDLNGLLEYKIGLDEIKAERYYSKDKDDVFS